MSDPVEETRHILVVGIDESFSAFSVGRLLSAFASGHPAVRLRVERGSASDVNAGVRNGDITVGVGLLSQAMRGMESRTLYSTQFVAVIPGIHRFALRQDLLLKELTDEKLVLLTNRHLQRISFDEEMDRRGLALKNTLEISDSDEVLSCVREGLGVGILFKEALHDTEQLRRVSITDLSVRHEIGYYRRQDRPDTVTKSFIDTIEATFR